MNVAHVQQAWQLTSDDHSYPHEQQLQHKISPCISSAEVQRIYMRFCTTKLMLDSLFKTQTLSSNISRRVASGIAADAVIFVDAQCMTTTSYTRAKTTI